MRKLQFVFPSRGNWAEFRMTALWRDEAGYQRCERYASAELPAERLVALEGVIRAIAGLGEPWQAVQVWARLVEFVVEESEEAEPVMQEAVELTVEAVSVESGGRRVFTVRDYPESFFIADEGVVGFFRWFTGGTA